MNARCLTDLHTRLASLRPELAANPAAGTPLSTDWQFLQESETKLIALMNGEEPPDSMPGNIEFGLTLYLIQNDLPDVVIDGINLGSDIVYILQLLGMPQSQITTQEYDNWKSVVEAQGVVASDGTLVSTVTYATLDDEWVVAYIYYLVYTHYSDFSWVGVKPAPFGTTPATIPVTGSTTLKIALVGDWGTGPWTDGDSALCPSQLVAKAVEQLAPDMVIHLGDVYYEGTQAQEQSNLLGPWPTTPKGSFTLNSNHEMYDGANGYFYALTQSTFAAQKNTSYFAITFADWVILGLDSAYYDPSTLYMAGALVDAGQIGFVQQTLAQNPGKRVIVLTHHNALAYDGQSVSVRSDGSLLNDVFKALNKRFPDFWYCGHIHNGLVYNDLSIAGMFYLNSPFKHPKFRCFGNGGIPFGLGYGLQSTKVAKGLDYYAKTPMGTSVVQQQNRVLNGFVMLTLQKGSITEEALEVSNGPDGTVQIECKWHATTTYS